MATSEEKKAYNRSFYARKGHIKRREYNLRNHYGMTIADYNAMLEKQAYTCGICDVEEWQVKRFHVDHDHNTGAVRALLCGNCNRALGALQDSPALADAAASYLRQHGRG